MLRVNRITEWSSTFAFFLFLFSFLLLFFFLVGGFGFVNLTEENFTGAQSRWLPRPRAGPSYECKTEITSERGCPECWPRPTERGRPSD